MSENPTREWVARTNDTGQALEFPKMFRALLGGPSGRQFSGARGTDGSDIGGAALPSITPEQLLKNMVPSGVSPGSVVKTVSTSQDST